MTTDDFEQELGIMQLSDSFFPTGLFATSNGLEYLFSQNKIKTATELHDLIKIYLKQQIGPSDCIAAANAFSFAQNFEYENLIKADKMIHSLKMVKEVRDASARSGSQLVRCVAEFVKDDEVLKYYYEAIKTGKVSGAYSVALAICCNALGIKKEKLILILLYGFTVSAVGAALRLGMIQHFEGQKIIHQLKKIMHQTAIENSSKKLEEMWQFCPQLDIIQMSHEKMDAKMFIT